MTDILEVVDEVGEEAYRSVLCALLAYAEEHRLEYSPVGGFLNELLDDAQRELCDFCKLPIELDTWGYTPAGDFPTKFCSVSCMKAYMGEHKGE